MSPTTAGNAQMSNNPDNGLLVTSLWKHFSGTPVLSGINLVAARGEIITVLGPSGSGKTTLLRLLCGFERADAGCIELGGRLVTAADSGIHIMPEQRGIGYVAQEGALFPHLSVADNLLFGLPKNIRKAKRSQRLERARNLLRLVDLPPLYAARRPGALSGGEQQRVALARALASSPTIVLLDEPFSALDAGLRAGLRDTIVKTLRRVGTTALLVTHDQDEALSTGDRVAVMHEGRFAQIDTPQALYRNPVSRSVARFVGDAIFAQARVTEHGAECRFGCLPLVKPVAPGKAEIMIRPEQIRLCDATQETEGAIGKARVEDVCFYGHDAQLKLRTNDGAAFTAAVSSIDLPQTGAEINFRIVGPVIAYPGG